MQVRTTTVLSTWRSVLWDVPSAVETAWEFGEGQGRRRSKRKTLEGIIDAAEGKFLKAQL